MSITLMTVAWKSNFSSGKKMVLLALCDNANDQGECFPSISMLSEKCSLSERSVFNHISDLEKNGAIWRENRVGRSTIYHLDPCKFCTPTPADSAPHPCKTCTPANSAPMQPLHPTPADSAPPPLQILHPTPADSAPITINEPSIEPSGNHQKKKREVHPFELPDWIPAETWAAFMLVRKAKKAASTDFALGLILKDLTKFKNSGHDPVDILERSIRGGWSDVYEPKQRAIEPGSAATKTPNKQQALEARNRAVAEEMIAEFNAKNGVEIETV
jgi:hypothetical protein